MLVTLREFVRNVLVIIVLASFLQLILPRGSMRRYAHLALALVMVLTLLSPLLALTRASWNIEELLGQAQAQTAWSELQASSQALQRQNDLALLQAYRQMLRAQVEDLLAQVGEVELIDCQIELVEEQRAEDFGRILSMHVVCRPGSAAVEGIKLIEPVQIGTGVAEQKEDAPPSEWAVEKGQEVRRAIARYFLLSEDQVLVTIR
ncbi:MAG: stage III sporulation protein AF [Firmicutes bacterium]|nr:stage III sporulation protein AF [Bacillota bacterium]